MAAFCSNLFGTVGTHGMLPLVKGTPNYRMGAFFIDVKYLRLPFFVKVWICTKKIIVRRFACILLGGVLYWLRLSALCKYRGLEALAVAGWIDFLWRDRPWFCVRRSSQTAGALGRFFCISLHQGHLKPQLYTTVVFTAGSLSTLPLTLLLLPFIMFFSFWHFSPLYLWIYCHVWLWVRFKHLL